MQTRRYIAASLLAVAALGATSATAYAAPAATAPDNGSTLQADIMPGIHYTASIVDSSVVLRTDSGSLTVQGSQFQVLDDQGKLVAGLPLTYLKDGKEWPIAAQVDGNTATFTPETDPAQARPAAMLQPVGAEDFDSALSTAATQFGLATGIGTLLGSLIGGALGCVAGAIIGAPLVVPTFFVGPIGLCLTGAAAGVTLGVAAGVILIGVPVGIAAALQFYDTVYVK